MLHSKLYPKQVQRKITCERGKKLRWAWKTKTVRIIGLLDGQAFQGEEKRTLKWVVAPHVQWLARAPSDPSCPFVWNFHGTSQTRLWWNHRNSDLAGRDQTFGKESYHLIICIYIYNVTWRRDTEIEELKDSWGTPLLRLTWSMDDICIHMLHL